MSATPPRLAVLELLRARGFPFVLAGPAGVLPTTIVWVDEPDDPVLRLLPRAFGGRLMLELRDHHGEATPAFWLGIGRGAALASLALARRRAVEPRDGAGTLLGAEAPALWSAFEELCEALLRPERGAPPAEQPTREEIAEAAAALTARVDAAFPLAAHIASGLSLALGSELREAARSSPEYVLPAPSERARWVDAFLARLRDPA